VNDIHIAKPSASVRAQFDLTERVAIVTGGAGFLGMQHAEALAEMGAIPVLFDLDRTRLEEAAARVKAASSGRCETATADITDAKSLRAATDAVMQRHGRIDVLVNNAALAHAGLATQQEFFAEFEDYRRELWDAGLTVNITGTMLACQVVGPLMVGQGKGAIINIASDVGVISPDPRIYRADDHGYQGVAFNSPPFYAVSKAAVIHLTKLLAVRWGPHNVRVNALSPAGVYRGHDPAFVAKLSATMPLGRMAAENEYKGAIVFLASDASSFMTGHNLVMDGGRTAW
jgi:NAD(P)-dependent dehydrogenase (short-subunit alcohol dehydrogenase family)